MKGKHRIAGSNDAAASTASPITKEEENALGYIAGYVCRKVQGIIKSSSLPHEDKMLLFISELRGDELDEENGPEEWLNAIGRGGLWNVNDNTYTIFHLLEEEIREHLKAHSARTLDTGMKENILDAEWRYTVSVEPDIV